MTGGSLAALTQYVGYNGSGGFTQSGGTNAASGPLYVGCNAGSAGAYNQTGGLLSAPSEYVGYYGTGTFTQSGGTNALAGGGLSVGIYGGGNGTYTLSGNGQLSAANEYLGNAASGTGGFVQSGGTNTVSTVLYLGYGSGSTGTYSLSGTGQLSAVTEYIGFNSAASASFQQSGGTNAASYLTIGSGGQYQLSGGTLDVSGGLVDQGVFSGGLSPATLVANGIVNLTTGTWTNLADLSVDMGANSLLIVPPGFNPSTGFASYTSLGLTHTAGTTLTVPAGQSFSGSFSTGNPVACQGTITATSGSSINMSNGLVVSGSGGPSIWAAVL